MFDQRKQTKKNLKSKNNYSKLRAYQYLHYYGTCDSSIIVSRVNNTNFHNMLLLTNNIFINVLNNYIKMVTVLHKSIINRKREFNRILDTKLKY